MSDTIEFNIKLYLQLLRLCETMSNSIQFDDSQDQEKFMVLYYARMLKIASGVGVLSISPDNNLIIVLFRSFLEAYVDFRNNLLHKNYHKHLLLAAIQHHLSDEQVSDVSLTSEQQTKLENIQKKEKELLEEGIDIIKPSKKFKMAGLKKLHKSIYSLLSKKLHNDILALLDDHKSPDPEELNYYIHGASDSSNDLQLLKMYLLLVLEATLDLHDKLTSCEKENILALKGYLDFLHEEEKNF